MMAYISKTSAVTLVLATAASLTAVVADVEPAQDPKGSIGPATDVVDVDGRMTLPGLKAGGGTGEARIAIDVKFPGGNVLVQKNAGATVNITPDLRGGRPWFYWYFEATVERPGRVNFVFPGKIAGVTGPPIGMQGSAVSLDLGKTWEWAGADSVKENTFFHDFKKVGQKVRFAVTMPYLQGDLDGFLKENEGNEHLTKGVLTKSLKGRPVELLQIGKPGPGVEAVLFTARHHACESMASFVLEGFLKAAISDTPPGVEFRGKHVLYAVPFVDKDGVEEGDQGKNRNPHDHNRDYGKGSIFPEIDAVEKLGNSRNIRFLVDFHCPTLQYADHQVIYFVGSKATPANNEENVRNFARLITKALPPNSPHGPLVWLKKREPMASGDHCSNHFAFREGMIMAATIEIPFAPPKAIMNASRGREIGQAMLNAWVRTKFARPKL